MPDSAADLFDRLAPGYDADGSHAALAVQLLDQAAEAFAGEQPQTVVDVGTGTGAAAFAAARRFPAAAVTGASTPVKYSWPLRSSRPDRGVPITSQSGTTTSRQKWASTGSSILTNDGSAV